MTKKLQNKTDAEAIAIQIWKDFKLEPDKRISDLKSLERRVAKMVSEMMDSQFQLLLQALYRIDVDEDDFKRVLAQESPDTVALAVARLIIARELRKVQTRQKYQQTNIRTSPSKGPSGEL